LTASFNIGIPFVVENQIHNEGAFSCGPSTKIYRCTGIRGGGE